MRGSAMVEIVASLNVRARLPGGVYSAYVEVQKETPMSRITIRTWFALILCVWLTVTGLVVALWFGIGPIGPRSDHYGTHATANLMTLAVWILLPVVLARFGVNRGSTAAE